jgi:multicomponent Na+:H+ antiporter subunit G
MALHAGLSLVTFKLFLIFAFFFFTSPTASHALGKAALLGGLQPLTDGDEPPDTPGR